MAVARKRQNGDGSIDALVEPLDRSRRTVSLDSPRPNGKTLETREADKPSREEAEAAVRTLIQWAGDDPLRPGLHDTPARVVRAYEEWFSGYAQNPEILLIRTFDELGYGGEEFVVVMPDTDLEEGLAILERLREGLALAPQALGSEEPVYVTASFGVVLLEPSVSVETSIKRADKALYAAKAAGRNRSAVWDPSMDANPGSSLHTAA